VARISPVLLFVGVSVKGVCYWTWYLIIARFILLVQEIRCLKKHRLRFAIYAGNGCVRSYQI
jgi:membrane-bound ClpP family serine protease